ncbi:MAG: EamA family transporter [Gammaproteobacteria bacterium]|nr:EamA family transporter [Gammaproteobacteria bacterium]MCP5137284.1 EamA family transporter [Gammaproteobacteria bacterium]
MSVPAAYLSVILIWTTTPLAIAWSSEGGDFLFAVTARMAIGLLVVWGLVGLLRVHVPRHREALATYLAAGLGIFFAMSLVYWSAQRIPSGWIAVVFGLSPIVTGVMARLWLRSETMRVGQWLGMGMGVVGLAVMMLRPGADSDLTTMGVIAMLGSVLAHSASSIWVKRWGREIPGMAVTAGGLVLALPLFLLLWWQTSAVVQVPDLTFRAWASLGYLAVIGTGVGFALYYYVLRELDPVRAALITLITPATALWLGHWANQEPLDLYVLAGSGLIIGGLAAFQFTARKVRVEGGAP